MRFPFHVDAAVPLYLAPMAGVSEAPFRQLCRRWGADVVETEFLSAEGIRRENPATLSKLRFGPEEQTVLLHGGVGVHRVPTARVDLDVQVRAGHVAGRADQADDLSAGHGVSH